MKFEDIKIGMKVIVNMDGVEHTSGFLGKTGDIQTVSRMNNNEYVSHTPVQLDLSVCGWCKPEWLSPYITIELGGE